MSIAGAEKLNELAARHEGYVLGKNCQKSTQIQMLF
jgi:hypothetical protein